MFLGLIMKHQRVQIAPVAVRARFCVRERFSTGRQKSLMPARTMDHCKWLVSSLSFWLFSAVVNELPKNNGCLFSCSYQLNSPPHLGHW